MLYNSDRSGKLEAADRERVSSVSDGVRSGKLDESVVSVLTVKSSSDRRQVIRKVNGRLVVVSAK